MVCSSRFFPSISAPHRAQFDELQTAWRHQCAADIKGNNSSFKLSSCDQEAQLHWILISRLVSSFLVSSSDFDLSSTTNEECRICVPSLNMCFTTNKIHALNIQGNIFDLSKSTHPLTIQDYIAILIDHDQFVDQELSQLINNIRSLTARYRRLNGSEDLSTAPSQRNGDQTIDEKVPSESLSSTESSQRRKQESDSIVRGILNNSMKYNQEKSSGDLSSTPDRLVNGNARTTPTVNNSTKVFLSLIESFGRN